MDKAESEDYSIRGWELKKAVLWGGTASPVCSKEKMNTGRESGGEEKEMVITRKAKKKKEEERKNKEFIFSVKNYKGFTEIGKTIKSVTETDAWRERMRATGGKVLQ